MDNNDQKSLKQIIDYRIKKINELLTNGIEPFPYKFKKDYNKNGFIQRLIWVSWLLDKCEKRDFSNGKSLIWKKS